MARAKNPGRKRPLSGKACKDCPVILTPYEIRQGLARCPPCRTLAVAQRTSTTPCPCGLPLTRREVGLGMVRCGRCRQAAPGRVLIDHTPTADLKAPTSWWMGKTRAELNEQAHDAKNLDRMRRGVNYWSGLLHSDEPRRSAKAAAEA